MKVFIACLLILFTWNEQAQAETSKESNFRIVSLHPALTENLFALGLGKHVVGTTSYSDYPSEAKEIPRVGDHQFSAEKILALRPTHILSISDRFGISKALADQISAKLINLQLENLEDYPTALSRLGQIFKVEGAAQALIQNWQRDWQQVKGQAKNKRVLLQVQQSPIVAVGTQTFLNRILETCGAKNALAAHKGYPKLNRETVYKLKPDQVVLLLTHDLTNTQALKDLPAGTKVSHFEPDILSRLTPRLPMEAKKFCETL